MGNVGNAFSLPFKSADWLPRMLVIGLIGLIPIAGQLNMLGWMLATLDNYRRGQTELPPAGFQYMGRGLNLFVVQLVYGLVVVALIVVPLMFFLVSAGSFSAVAEQSGASSATSPALAPMMALFPVWFGGITLGTLVLYVFMAPVIVNTERGGIGGGLNPAALWATASRHWGHTLLAGILIYAAYFIAGIGIYACCVGYLVTLPYGYAVVAGVVRFYEATFEPSQPGPPAPAPAY